MMTSEPEDWLMRSAGGFCRKSVCKRICEDPSFYHFEVDAAVYFSISTIFWKFIAILKIKNKAEILLRESKIEVNYKKQKPNSF